MGLSEILQLLQTGSVLLAILVAVGTLRGRESDKTAELTEMRVDIKYIKERIDGMDRLREGLSAVEASTRSAHKRLDEHIRYEHHKEIERSDHP